MFQDLDDVGWRQEPIDDEHLPIRRHRAIATPPLGNYHAPAERHAGRPIPLRDVSCASTGR